MINPQKQNTFLECLAKLNISPTDYPAMILTYKILQHITKTAISLQIQDIRKKMQEPQYQRALQKYRHIDVSYSFRGGDETCLRYIKCLCQIIQEENFCNDYISFFRTFTPGLAVDWGALQKMNSRGIQVLEALMGLYEGLGTVAGTEIIYEYNPNDYFDAIRKYSSCVSDEDAERIWAAAMYAHYNTPDTKTWRISKAISAYAKKGKSKDTLLNDYLLQYRDVGQKPICYNKLSKDDQKKTQVEKLPREEEVNYYTATKLLAVEAPCKVTAVLYYDEFCDPIVENTLPLYAFLASVHRAKAPVILNPSPYMLLALEAAVAPMEKILMVVPSRSIALALSQQFGKSTFYAVDELRNDPVLSDLILMIDIVKDRKNASADILDCINADVDAELVALVNENVLTSGKSGFMKKMNNKGLAPSQIIRINQSRVAAKRKRCLLVASTYGKRSEDEKEKIPVYACVSTSTRDYVFVAPNRLEIPVARLETGVSLSKLVKQEGRTGKEIKHRNVGKTICWSPEIVINYTSYNVSTTDGSYIRARAYIRKMDDTNYEKRGNAIAGARAEISVNGESEEKWIEKIRQMPLREGMYKLILNEVLRVYGDKPQMLSLKTIWFCLRPELQKMMTYDDELAQQLFCRENQSVSNLTLTATYEEFCDAIMAVVEVDSVPLRFWKLMRQIAALAKEYSFAEQNVIEDWWPEITANGKQRLYQVQEALRKWCFTDEEMKRMFLPLIASEGCDELQVHRYVWDSHALMGLYIMFSLIRKRELCALNIGDIEYMPNGGAQARITKYVDKNGTVQQYTGRGKERNLIRKSALPPILAACTKEYVEHLRQTMLLTEESLKEQPLFAEEVPKEQKIKRCSVDAAAEVYRTLLECAGIPENKIVLLNREQMRVVDMGISRKTEYVYMNNIRIMASAYGLEDGELCYNAGTEPETTIDAHYIGYDAPQNQIATSAKMHRMTAKYCEILFPRNAVPERVTVNRERGKIKKSFVVPQDKMGKVILELVCESSDGAFQIAVSTKYGHSAEMTVWGGDTNDQHENK